MNTEYKAKLIEALRSGKYKQTTNCLRDTNGYCCLGVLCDIVGVIWLDAHDDVYDDSGEYSGEYVASYKENNNSSMLPDSLMSDVGLNYAEQAYLAQMNDEHTSFKGIADYIEENL